MKVVYWPTGDNKGAESHTITTLEGLWRLIRTKEPAAYERGFIREISANENDDNEPYLVISWVAVEEKP